MFRVKLCLFVFFLLVDNLAICIFPDEHKQYIHVAFVTNNIWVQINCHGCHHSILTKKCFKGIFIHGKVPHFLAPHLANFQYGFQSRHCTIHVPLDNLIWTWYMGVVHRGLVHVGLRTTDTTLEGTGHVGVWASQPLISWTSNCHISGLYFSTLIR